MKRLFSTIAFCIWAFNSMAQTTATDFTATDCNGAVKNLFTELDNGKIVVLVWVEPCVGCISDAQAAFKATQSFSSSYPNKVLFWLVDDVGDTPCSTLYLWAQTNGIPTAHIQLFGNVGNTIDENNYGGLAMPHVVVMGNNSHHIYCNILGGANDSVAISTAIFKAITNGVNDLENNKVFSVFPNPVTDNMQIAVTITKPSFLQFELFDVLGRCLQTFSFQTIESGTQQFKLELDKIIPSGNYFLKCSNDKVSTVFPFIKSCP